MSRAFIKESDDVGEELPELSISAHRNLVTPNGLAQIEARVKVLQEDLATARQANDKSAVAVAERDLRYWNARRHTAEVVPLPASSEAVRFGATVVLEDEQGRQVEYQIVGEDEADPAAGKISYVAPLGQALMGRGIGETVTVGERTWELSRIEVPQ